MPFQDLLMACGVLKHCHMMTGEKLRIAPWQKGPMTNEQAEAYRRAIAPLQKSLAAAKGARQQVFKWLKGGVSEARQS
jgi:hypothetical protein